MNLMVPILTRARALPAWALCMAVFVVALGFRLHEMDAVLLLADGTGPWLSALANPFNLHPHALPYGWALLPPYALCLALAGSLAQAVGIMAALHALVAPAVSLCILRLRPGAKLPSLLAGLALALDGGLMDTFRSGAECYLAPTCMAFVCLGWACRKETWGPPLALVSFSVATMNHPYSTCALPILALLPWRTKRTILGALAALLLASPGIAVLVGHGIPDSGGIAALPIDALSAWFQQGGAGSWLLVLGLLAGFRFTETRTLMAAVLFSSLAMLMVGSWSGYLRDHHLRLLSVPAAVGLVGLPNWAAILSVALLRFPASMIPAPGHPHRPGTLGATSQISHEISLRVPRGLLVVDGLLISGTPAAEPSAVMLDMLLRGRNRGDFAPGGRVALVVSGEQRDLQAIDADKPGWLPRDSYFVVVDDASGIASYSRALCAPGARFGGAWDGLAVLNPETRMEDLLAWQPNCPAPVTD